VLIRAHAVGLYRACWSSRILNEAAENRVGVPVLRLADDFPECMITSDQYEPLIPATHMDPNDGHVTALCVRAQAEVIVAMEPDQFPESVLKPLGLEVQHPDEFLCYLLDLRPSTALRVVVELAADTRQPPRSVLQMLETLGRVAPNFADGVLYHLPAEMQSPT